MLNFENYNRIIAKVDMSMNLIFNITRITEKQINDLPFFNFFNLPRK